MTGVEPPPGLVGLMISGDLGPLTIYTTQKGKIVAFPKSPPHKPGSPGQLTQRKRFRDAQNSFMALMPSEQAAYDLVTRKLSICMTGANLWIHFCLRHDDGVFATVQQQTGLTLAPYLRL